MRRFCLRHRQQAGSYRGIAAHPFSSVVNTVFVGAGLPAMKPSNLAAFLPTPSPASRLLQGDCGAPLFQRCEHSLCRSRLAGDGAFKPCDVFEDAIAGKPAPTKFCAAHGREQIACHCAENALQAALGLGFRVRGGSGRERGVLMCKQAGACQLLLQQQAGSSYAAYGF
ncbi:hypothetical protein J2Y74_002406 [Pseudomonas migulae]|nr:hypothetical protein [Pseudomonas migulae]